MGPPLVKEQVSVPLLSDEGGGSGGEKNQMVVSHISVARLLLFCLIRRGELFTPARPAATKLRKCLYLGERLICIPACWIRQDRATVTVKEASRAERGACLNEMELV